MCLAVRTLYLLQPLNTIDVALDPQLMHFSIHMQAVLLPLYT
jgi:hypothetical protein